MNTQPNLDAVRVKVSELKAETLAFIEFIKAMQDNLEAQYNLNHEDGFVGFGDEDTPETETINALDCILAHMYDVVDSLDRSGELLGL